MQGNHLRFKNQICLEHKIILCTIIFIYIITLHFDIKFGLKGLCIAGNILTITCGQLFFAGISMLIHLHKWMRQQFLGIREPIGNLYDQIQCKCVLQGKIVTRPCFCSECGSFLIKGSLFTVPLDIVTMYIYIYIYIYITNNITIISSCRIWRQRILSCRWSGNRRSSF